MTNLILSVNYLKILELLVEGSEYKFENKFVETEDGGFNSLYLYKGEVEVMQYAYSKGKYEEQMFIDFYKWVFMEGLEMIDIKFKEKQALKRIVQA